MLPPVGSGLDKRSYAFFGPEPPEGALVFEPEPSEGALVFEPEPPEGALVFEPEPFGGLLGFVPDCANNCALTAGCS